MFLNSQTYCVCAVECREFGAGSLLPRTWGS